MVHLPIFSVEAPQLSYYRIGRIAKLFRIARLAPEGNQWRAGEKKSQLLPEYVASVGVIFKL
jgi:hypothetical protein